MGWYNIFKTMPNVGTYAGLQFNTGTIGATWNWLHITGQDLARALELDAQYNSNPSYVGGVPGSGPELDELEVRAISTDANNPTELFGVLVYGDEDDPKEAIIIKAYRNAAYTWSVYGSTTDISVLIYKRVYTDAATYTDTQVALVGCRVPLSWVHAHLEFFEYEDTWCIGISDYFYDGSDIKSFWALWAPTRAAFLNAFHRAPQGKEKSAEYGEESQQDGYGYDGVIGSHDKHSDHSGIPPKPQYGFTSAGFLNHYRISAQGLSMLGEALFPEPVGSSSSVEEAIDKLIANSWNSKILDYIVDCRIIPVTPNAPTQEHITCGGKVLVHPTTHQQYTAYLINEDFVDVDCGYVETPLVEGNFLDFYNLKCKLFLPFYGFVDIEPEYWMGAKIGVYYRFNCMDGSFMCWVTSKAFRSGMNAGDVIGQYSGNACIHIPISSQSYSQIVNGLITTGASVVGAVAGGAAGGKIAGTIASGAATAITSRPTLNKSNSYSGSSALMSKRTPYLLIEFNEAQFSRRYVDEQGLPAVVTKTLASCKGFTQASNPILDGIPCTETEKERIRAALASGLIFK